MIIFIIEMLKDFDYVRAVLYFYDVIKDYMRFYD